MTNQRWEDIIFTLLEMHPSKVAAYFTPLIYWLGIFFSNEKGQGKRRLGCLLKSSSEG